MIDVDRIDETLLALIWLGLHDYKYAKKTFDREALVRLQKKGMLSDVGDMTDFVIFTEEGRSRAAQLYREMFMADEVRDSHI